MEKIAVFEKVKKIITPYCKNTEALDSATDESRFLEELAINSARLVDIVIDFEDEFSIEVSDDEADTIRTIGQAVTLIVAKTS